MSYSPDLIVKLKLGAMTKSPSSKQFGVQGVPWNGRVMKMFADEDYHRSDKGIDDYHSKYKNSDVWLAYKIAVIIGMSDLSRGFSTAQFPYTDEVIRLNDERLAGTMTEEKFDELVRQASSNLSAETLSSLV